MCWEGYLDQIVIRGVRGPSIRRTSLMAVKVLDDSPLREDWRWERRVEIQAWSHQLGQLTDNKGLRRLQYGSFESAGESSSDRPVEPFISLPISFPLLFSLNPSHWESSDDANPPELYPTLNIHSTTHKILVFHDHVSML